MADEMSDRFALPLLAAGQAQKEITHNEALTRIDMLLHPCAESRALAAPPAGAQAGQCWIVASGASGDWEGREGCLALLTSGGWRFAEPRAGLCVLVAKDGFCWRHDGTAWLADGARPNGYYVEGQRVVGARVAAIADPAGGSFVDAEARLAIGQLLAMLRTHGLIEGP